MTPQADRSAVASPEAGDHLRLVPDARPEDALADVPVVAERPTWEMPANVVSLWDPEHRDERPCEILPTADRDLRWPVVGLLSLAIVAGTVALLALVS